MKTPKKIWITLLLIIGVLCAPVATFSHSGRTDANGGHWDRKTGTYHYHDGTSKSGSSGSSSKREYEPFTPPYTPPPNNPYRSNSSKNTTSNSKTSNKTTDVIFWAFLIGLFGVMPICMIGKIKIEESIYNRKNEVLKLIDETRRIIHKEEYCKNRIDEAIEYLSSPPTMVTMPSYIEMTNTGLSAKNNMIGIDTEINEKKLYTPFVFYITRSGRRLHTKKNCSNSRFKLNVFEDITRLDKMLPCKKCASNIDENVIDTIKNCYSSFITYKKYEQRKSKYQEEIKKNQYELTTLAQEKERVMQELQNKNEYIKKHEDLSEKYKELLTYNNHVAKLLEQENKIKEVYL